MHAMMMFWVQFHNREPFYERLRSFDVLTYQEEPFVEGTLRWRLDVVLEANILLNLFVIFVFQDMFVTLPWLINDNYLREFCYKYAPHWWDLLMKLFWYHVLTNKLIIYTSPLWNKFVYKIPRVFRILFYCLLL